MEGSVHTRGCGEGHAFCENPGRSNFYPMLGVDIAGQSFFGLHHGRGRW